MPTIAVGLVAAAPSFPATVAACVLAGAATITFLPLETPPFSSPAEPEYRGRVIALWSMALVGSTAIGLAGHRRALRRGRAAVRAPSALSSASQPWPSAAGRAGRGHARWRARADRAGQRHQEVIPASALDNRFWDAMHAVAAEQLEEASRKIAGKIVQASGVDCSSVALDMTNFATFIATANGKAPIAQRARPSRSDPTADLLRDNVVYVFVAERPGGTLRGT